MTLVRPFFTIFIAFLAGETTHIILSYSDNLPNLLDFDPWTIILDQTKTKILKAKAIGINASIVEVFSYLALIPTIMFSKKCMVRLNVTWIVTSTSWYRVANDSNYSITMVMTKPSLDIFKKLGPTKSILTLEKGFLGSWATNIRFIF